MPLALGRPGADTVIDWPAIGSALVSTSVYSIWLPVEPAFTRGASEAFRSAPSTVNEAARVKPALVAVTVTTRFERSAPMLTAAVT